MPTVQKIVYWDEANRIPFFCLIAAFVWAALTQATTIVATHTDLGPMARLLGLSVKTIYLPPFDADLLMAWAKRRIEAVRLPDSECDLSLTYLKAEKIAMPAEGSWRVAANHLHIWTAEAAKSEGQPKR